MYQTTQRKRKGNESGGAGGYGHGPNPSKIKKKTSGSGGSGGAGQSPSQSSKSQLIKCPHCNNPGFDHLIELWSHLISKHLNFMDTRRDLVLNCAHCHVNFMKDLTFRRRKGVDLLKAQALKRIDWHYRTFHPDKVGDEEPAPCLICNEKFMKQPDLTKHYIKHFSLHMMLVTRKQKKKDTADSKSIPFVLMEILSSGSTPSLVLEDRKDPGIGTSPRKCRSCPQSFDEPLSLYAHHYKTHTSNGPYTCDFCELSFQPSEMTRFVSHLEDHFPQKRQDSGLTNCYSCGIGEKTFPNVDLRNKHKSLYKELALVKKDSEEYKEVLGALISPTGIRSTERPSPRVNLESEMANLYPEAQGYYPCQHCGIHFSINFHLWTHIHDYHSAIIDQGQPYQCGFCNLGFGEDQIKGYQKHVKKHQALVNISPGSPKFKKVLDKIMVKKNTTAADFDFDELPKHQLTCTICKKLFPRPMDLWNHILTLHPMDPTRYKYCEYCCSPFHFETAQYSNVILHFLAIHSGDKKKRAMGCYVCVKCFETEDERAEHLKLHEKLYRMSEGSEDYASVLFDILNPPNSMEKPWDKQKFSKETAPRVELPLPQPTGEESNNLESGHKLPIYATTTKIKYRKPKCPCGICGKEFKGYQALGDHRRKVHPRTSTELASAPEPRNCIFFQECNKSYSFKDDMVEHVAMKHKKYVIQDPTILESVWN